MYAAASPAGWPKVKQQELWNYLKPHLAGRIPVVIIKGSAKPKGIQLEGPLRNGARRGVAGNILIGQTKVVLGNWITGTAEKTLRLRPGPWAWALGGLGLRVPTLRKQSQTVDAEQATTWLSLLLEGGGAAGAWTARIRRRQLARLTGRPKPADLNDRFRGASWLLAVKSAGAPEAWLRGCSVKLPPSNRREARAWGTPCQSGGCGCNCRRRNSKRMDRALNIGVQQPIVSFGD